jgi:hypothetical protein
MKPQRTYYMHMLDETPAGFFDGKSVCFTWKRIPLAKSLRQIRREQQISKRHDVANRSGPFRYSYITVTLPK